MSTNMTSNTRKACYLVTWAFIDVGICTMLYPQQFDNYRSAFLSDLLNYGIRRSMLDLWIFSLIRTSFIIGALLGSLRNPADGAKRVNKSRIFILVLTIIMWDFPIVKLLIYSEESNENDPFFWAIFSWSLLASVVFFLNWILLGEFKSIQNSPAETSNSINSTPEERQSLLGGNTTSDGNESSTEDQKDKQPKPSRSSTILWLLSLSKPDLHLIFLAFTFLLVAAVSQIFTPWYTGQVIEGIAITKNKAHFTRAIILMALFSAGSALAAGIRGGTFSVCMARLKVRISTKLFTALIKQEIGFFDKTQTGEIMSRLTSDTTVMSDSLSFNVNVFMRSIITAVGICVFMFKLSWQLSMVTVIGLPIILGISKVYGEYYEKLAKEIQDKEAKGNEVANEVYSSMRTVRSFAGEICEIHRYTDRLDDTYKVKKKESLAYAGYVWSSQLFELFLVVGTLFYGGYLVIDGLITGGHLVSFILYQMELGYQLESIANVYSGLMQASGASQKVYEFICRQPAIPNQGTKKTPTLKGRIEFKDVSFTYPSRPDTEVLKNVSFSVEPGEIVALVGPSGGGKSSCIGLLEHFYETMSGQVLLDDVPIQDYDHHFLHEKISLVGQEPVLYARSITDNIAYGMDVWDIEMVQKAAQMANAHDFIQNLKDKYETQTGEKGVQLSGGQKQRVAIARAVIRNPTILLLDEATSALDAESEHVVQDAIYKNLKGRTVILIAHRLSTVEKANRIIVINKGTVVEQGTHTELLAQEGLYSKLVQRQLLGQDIGLTLSQNKLDGSSACIMNSTIKENPEVKISAPTQTTGSLSKYGSISPQAPSPLHSFHLSENVNFQIGTPRSGSFADGSFC